MLRQEAAASGAILAGLHVFVVGSKDGLCFRRVVHHDHFFLSERNAAGVPMKRIPAVTDSALIPLLDKGADLLPRYALGGRPRSRGAVTRRGSAGRQLSFFLGSALAGLVGAC